MDSGPHFYVFYVLATFSCVGEHWIRGGIEHEGGGWELDTEEPLSPKLNCELFLSRRAFGVAHIKN